MQRLWQSCKLGFSHRAGAALTTPVNPLMLLPFTCRVAVPPSLAPHWHPNNTFGLSCQDGGALAQGAHHRCEMLSTPERGLSPHS